ncbi:hypothetical protein AB0K18_34415 [Nonomuraea sp. NPDC049421]|uniref:hypothetical protein n=1 Tax=Nonomuraea sp. NPDC049421 TaxID=3155275 RepID=UPI0034143108
MIPLLRPGRLIALALAAAAIIVPGLSSPSCSGFCPDPIVAADGTAVSDRFWFFHRELGREGAITVRLAAMTGTITYPPPRHDRIVSGLVPWAKTGIIVKDGLRQGSSYAALMMTGRHGIRFQHDYLHDVAVPGTARWLRLTRSGDVITGYTSADGARWDRAASATLKGLPETVRVGLFAASPGDLTLRETGLGGAVEEVRFTQAVGVFDHVTVEGSAGGWGSESVGSMNETDWEKHHNASGAVSKDGTIKISGTGDIGPFPEEGARAIESSLVGLPVALLVLTVMGARSATARVSAVGAATFVTGLLAVGTVILAQSPVSPLTAARVIVGCALALALCTVIACRLGRFRRAGVLAAVCLIPLPAVLTAFPLLPDVVADWLLRVTPAAGFAVKQTLVEYPQVTAHYAPSTGYHPLPGWAGMAVLGAYALIVMLRRDEFSPPDRSA